MLQLDNTTPFAASVNLLSNEAGIDTLYLVVKSSFNIGSPWTLATEQDPPQLEDIYRGRPNQSSLKYASDSHPGKPATDIVMIGHAITPGGEELSQMDVSLKVGRVSKTIRVIGDREWINGKITSPTTFKTMPMVYEKAYGGIQFNKGVFQSSEERNPVGIGYVGIHASDETNTIPLPNLEDPEHLIRDQSDQPYPACFAPVAPAWQPRIQHAGSYDENWETKRAPYLPLDFNRSFCNSAHRDLIYPGYLRGDEEVQIINMHHAGELRFKLPGVRITSKIKIGRRIERPEFKLETLSLEPNKLKMNMFWRASFDCDRIMSKIKQLRIALAR